MNESYALIKEVMKQISQLSCSEWRKDVVRMLNITFFLVMMLAFTSCDRNEKEQLSQRELEAKARMKTLLQKFNAIEYKDPRHEYTIDLRSKFNDKTIVATARIQDVIENTSGNFTAIATTTNTIFKLDLDKSKLSMLDTSRFKGWRKCLIAVDSLEMHKVLDLNLSYEYQNLELVDLEDGRTDFGVRLRNPYYFATGRLLEVVKRDDY
jgi:hypothetical protein